MSSQREEYLKALHYNNATDGFNYYYTRAIQNRYQLLSSVGFNNVFSNYHNTSGVAMVVGNKVPIFGNGGARWVSDENNAPYNLGYNVLYNGDEDDDYCHCDNGSTMIITVMMVVEIIIAVMICRVRPDEGIVYSARYCTPAPAICMYTPVHRHSTAASLIE